MLKHAIEYIRIRFALRNGSKQSRSCAKFTAMRYPGYAFPSACMCTRVYVATENNRRFWIRDDILLYGGRLYKSAVCPPCVSANNPRLGRENPSSPKKYSEDMRDVPFTFVSVRKDDSQAHVQFFFNI